MPETELNMKVSDFGYFICRLANFGNFLKHCLERVTWSGICHHCSGFSSCAIEVLSPDRSGKRSAQQVQNEQTNKHSTNSDFGDFLSVGEAENYSERTGLGIFRTVWESAVSRRDVPEDNRCTSSARSCDRKWHLWREKASFLLLNHNLHSCGQEEKNE
jgi:hypothetical protein